MLKLTFFLTAVLIVAYGFSLSLPITIPWTILILGIITMIIHLSILFYRRGEIYPPAGRFHRPLQIFTKAPMLKALAIFAIAIFLSGLVNGGLPEAFKSFCSLR